jgi:phosphatidylcholine synthase
VNNPSQWQIIGAAGVHLLTASGGALGLLALLAAAEGRWADSFAWLGVALAADGADGPLARRLDVKGVLPRFSGEDLDKVVDYLTYVAVPAFMVARAPVAPDALRLPLALAIMVVSLFHFADKESKTAAGYFVGFPALWNAIVLYCFVLNLPPPIAAALICACCILTFVPLRWAHPIRVKRLRPVTLAIIAIWSVAAVAAVWHGFPGGGAIRLIFLLAAVYIVALGLSAGPEEPGKVPTKPKG